MKPRIFVGFVHLLQLPLLNCSRYILECFLVFYDKEITILVNKLDQLRLIKNDQCLGFHSLEGHYWDLNSRRFKNTNQLSSLDLDESCFFGLSPWHVNCLQVLFQLEYSVSYRPYLCSTLLAMTNPCGFSCHTCLICCTPTLYNSAIHRHY